MSIDSLSERKFKDHQRRLSIATDFCPLYLEHLSKVHPDTGIIDVGENIRPRTPAAIFFMRMHIFERVFKCCSG